MAREDISVGEVIHKGMWWLPNKSEEQVGGELIFGVDQLNLSLLGALEDTMFGSGWPTHDIVRGHTTTGEQVTLVDCTLSGRHWSHPGFPTQTYRPAYALIGAGFDRRDDVRFSNARVRANHLEYWLGSWPLFIRPGIHEPNGQYRQELGYEQAQPLMLELTDAYFSAGQNFTIHEGLFETGVTYEASASFTLRASLNVEQWLEWYLQPLRNFLALTSGSPTRILRTQFAVEATDGRIEARKAPPIELLGHSFSLPGGQHEKKSQEMLLTLADTQENIAVVLDRWLALHRELNYVLNLYFGARDNPGPYMEQRFLSIVQALEGFHRHWFTPNMTKRKRTELKTRLADLASDVKDVMRPWTANDVGEATFTKHVADLRNDLSHILDTRGPQRLDSEALWWIMAGLRWLMEACLLRAIGLSVERVTELIQRNQRYLNAVRHAPSA